MLPTAERSGISVVGERRRTMIRMTHAMMIASSTTYDTQFDLTAYFILLNHVKPPAARNSIANGESTQAKAIVM